MNDDRPSPYRWQARAFEAYRPPNRLNRGLVTMAPWLSAALLLIFFLLVTSRFVLQPGIRIRLPESPFNEGVSPYGLMAVVVAQQTAGESGAREILFFDDARFVLTDGAGLKKVKAALTKAATDKPGQAMVIEADRLVRHGTMVNLINLAAAAGIPEVFVATRPAGRDGEGP